MDFEKALNLITEKLETWFSEFVRLLPNILLAALILVAGFFTAKLIRDFSAKYVKKISSNSALNSLFSSIIYVFLIGVTIFTALSVLQLDKAVTSILAGAGIIGLALAFAFQDIAANFISGIFISFRKPISIDDIVKVGDYMGEIKEINLRDTVLQTFQGEIVIIPNRDLFQNPIVNYSSLGKRRFDLRVGVSYGEDLEKVREVTLNAVKGIEELSKENETTLFFDGFGDSSINFTIRLWVDDCSQSSFLMTGNKAIMLIKKAYNENDIMIPFPIRTLDFGIKGGVPLNKALPGKE
ncbi:MAG TPA: mechanosensitive ion channel family protein [Ignavibacteria bacterium]|nr:mechanosensitive ion channel family protein [Ignavibacteria bacterium]HMR39392.1 mechanosensitive ion channel family protein [Ignavibacteria bacterium]